MNGKGIASVLATMVAAVVLVGGSGAGTTKTRGAVRVDVSTRSAVIHYLRSIHVNPTGVVIQRSARNYAGPNCPGKRWTCANTRHTVVQLARAHGKNLFACSTKRCSVLQISKSPLATNTAKCVKTTGITGTCSITQSNASADNVAIVYQKAEKKSGLTQTASYTASITQTASGATNKNTVCLTQDVTIDGSTNVSGKKMPVSVNLEAHQSVTITQNSASQTLGSGGNFAEKAASSSGNCDNSQSLLQNQKLTSTVQGSGLVVQNQNAVNGGPNISMDVKQNQGAGFLGISKGPNSAVFRQVNTLTAIATAPLAAGDVRQTQSSVNGGALAAVNQDSRDVSTADVTQTETQCQDAHASSGPLTCDAGTADPPGFSLSQTQFGPLRKAPGDSSQTGNNGDSFTVTQTTQQDNDTHSDQKNIVEGGFHTDGTGTANQTATIDGSTSNQSQSGTGDVTVTTSCNGPSCVTINGDQISATNTDVAEAGYGGMRGIGSGSITVSGIPAGSSITKAFLWWNGPTNSADPNSNAAVTFNGSPVTGTNIGTASSNCWALFANSQSYRADVTSLVTGNGSYSLADFVKPGGIDINGATLVVYYRDPTASNDRNTVLWNGNDSNIAQDSDPTGWDETITGVPYPSAGGAATLDLVVSDAQFDGTPSFEDDALALNLVQLQAAGNIFNGDTTPAGAGTSNGNLWDNKSFDITSSLVPGSNDLDLTTGVAGDCLSLVVAQANVPTSHTTLGPVTLQSQTQAATAALPAAPSAITRVRTGSKGGSLQGR